VSNALPCRRSTDFQTHLERRFTLGRFRGIGYTAGLEIWAANTKSFVHRNTVILPSQQLAVGVNANSTPTVTNVSRSAFVFKIVSLAFHCFGLW
jgi:hypothetical protein